MRKNIFLLSVFIVLVGCSTKKDAFVNRTYQNFTAYYNTLFHAKEALATELKNKNKEHRDNFYGGYIEVFPQDALATDTLASIQPNFFGGVSNNESQPENAFQVAEEKAMKAIEKKSMIFKGGEKNAEIFNAYILLAKSRIYQGKLFEALDALNGIYSTMPKDKRMALAKIYEGLIYSKLKNYTRAEDIFLTLDKDANLAKKYRKLWSVYYAQNLIYSGRKKESIDYLDLAIKYNKSRITKSRIAYLKGQVLSELGEKEKARESFVQAYKYANDFEFEVKSQIEIAKTFNAGEDYEEARKYLEKIGKKGIYSSRKNEFYYALGLMANRAGKKEEAQDFFTKALKEQISDSNIRGLTYFEIGQLYFTKDDYIRSGAYYDSALAVMDYEPIKQRIRELSSNIKNISKNFYLVKKNDSILALTKMSETQRAEYFQKYIDELKKKEEKNKIEQEKKSKREADLNNFDFSTNNFADGFNTTKSNKFYFANKETVAKGSLEFKKVWGSRSLGDNWRFSNTNRISLDDVEKKTLGRETVADARRFEIAYYIEKIPTDKQEIIKLKKERDTASLGLGRMYESYFQNTPLATKTLYDLVDNNPEDEVKLQALYLVFSMNFEKNSAAAEKAKKMIIEYFPYTPYAEFVKNPRRANFAKTEEEVKEVYQKAYGLFAEENFEESQKLVEQALQKYPKDALIPKFELLKAFITGKLVGKEIMALQLQQIVFNYEKTDEGQRAKEVLEYLKGAEEKKETKNMEPPIITPSKSTEMETSNQILVEEREEVPAQKQTKQKEGKDSNRNKPLRPTNLEEKLF